MSDEIKCRIRNLLVELIDVPEDNREEEILEILDSIVPDPEYLDYIYQSDEFYDEDDKLDLDGVINKIFSYKPIEL